MAHQGEVPPIELWEVARTTTTKHFCCGEKSVNQFIRREAWRAHTQRGQRVTCASVTGSSHVAGFVSLACVTEQACNLPGPYHLFGDTGTFPCLQLVWLGVDRSRQGQKIGTRLVGSAISKFVAAGKQIGLPHLILVPVSDAVKPFYRSLGFVEYLNGARMFLPLQSAMEAAGK